MRIRDVFDGVPPGYRFRPTSEELLSFYLKKKVLGVLSENTPIRDVDLYKYDPDSLIRMYGLENESVWYFFAARERKHSHGNRLNRLVGMGGKWKGVAKPEFIRSNGRIIGTKRLLDFLDLNGNKTDWQMHEYTLEKTTTHLDARNINEALKWSVCRIYKNAKKSSKHEQEDQELQNDLTGDSRTAKDHAPAMSRGFGEEFIPHDVMPLPVGYRFLPTNVELISFYLKNKILGVLPPNNPIPEVDLYGFDPNILTVAYKFDCDEWYFFTPREKKHSNGTRLNRRVDESGYWRTISKPEFITRNGHIVGTMRVLDFLDANGNKTFWKMHEYTLEKSGDHCLRNISQVDSVCKVYKNGRKCKKNDSTIISSDEQAIVSSTSVSTNENMLHWEVIRSVPMQDERDGVMEQDFLPGDANVEGHNISPSDFFRNLAMDEDSFHWVMEQDSLVDDAFEISCETTSLEGSYFSNVDQSRQPLIRPSNHAS